MKKKELKARIAELEEELQHVRSELADQTGEYECLMNRFNALGDQFEPLEGVDFIEAKVAKLWGNYVGFWHETGDVDEEKLNEAKKKLLYNIADGLMKKGMIQFVTKINSEDSPLHPLRMSTIGAKLYVIPWDKAVRRKKSVHDREVKQDE